jgi:beta-glucosidase
LIGSHMKTPAISGGGSASVEPYYVVSPYEAIQEKLKGQDVEIVYEVGAQAYKMMTIVGGGMIHTPGTFSQGGIIKFYNEPASVHDRVAVGAEHVSNLSFQLMDYNKNPSLNYDLFYARAEAIFTPDSSGIWDFGLTVCGTAMLYLDGKLLIDNATSQKPGSSFFGKGTAEETGSAFLEAKKRYQIMIDFGSSNTSTIKHVGVVSFGGGGARLGASLRLDAEAAIAKAAAAAETSDYAVICTGLNVRSTATPQRTIKVAKSDP